MTFLCDVFGHASAFVGDCIFHLFCCDFRIIYLVIVNNKIIEKFSGVVRQGLDNTEAITRLTLFVFKLFQ